MASGPPENPEPKSRPPRKPGGKPDDEAPRPFSVVPWFLLATIIIFGLYQFWQRPESLGSHVKYSFFKEQLKKKNIKSVEFHGEIITGEWVAAPDDPDKEGQKLKEKFNTTQLPAPLEDRDLVTLLEQNVEGFVDAERTSLPMATQLIIWLLGPLLFIGFFWFMLRRQADPMGSGMMGNFIRSPAKRFKPSDQQTTFDDVAGMNHAKQELSEVVEFLKNPAKFQRLVAQIPKGVLLMGPPGTGKTLLARATAGEAGVPFFSISGSEFIQMFVGVGASRVRDLFRTAKESAPAILFIDEIDAVGRWRGAGIGGGHDEREQTLNQILSEMDGFTPNDAVIVIAATNRPDVLDPALLRPGRFDRHVTIDRPTKEGRVGILKVHSRKVPLADNVDLERIAASTIGFSGADLRNLVNEAALSATREGKSAVDMDDFERVRDKVLMGPQREEVLNEHEKEMTSYHESGHALLAWLLSDVDLVHKVTIIPRGRALGVTQLLPDEDRFNIGERRLHQQLAFMLGGRAAEKLVFDEFSAGAEDDLKKATHLARRMVAHWGMSELIGPVSFPQGEDHPFLGKEMHEQRQYSEATAHVIDQEIQKVLFKASEEATRILIKHRDQLDLLAQTLLEKETLGSDELTALIGQRSAQRSTPVKVEQEAR